MKRSVAAASAALVASVLAFSASGKDDPKKEGAHLRWAATYAEALEESNLRGCVIFANFHIDH